MRNHLSLIGCSFIGAGIALVGVYALQWNLARADRGASQTQRMVAEAQETPPTRSFDSPVSRWSSLPAASVRPAASVESDEETASRQQPSSLPDSEVEQQELDAADESFAVAFQAEQADPTWAPAAKSKLGERLSQIGQQKGFTVGNIDCRTTKCKADVAFSNRQVARQSVGSLLHENYEPNCATSIRLPDADGERGEVAAALQLDCEETRVRELAVHDDSR